MSNKDKYKYKITVKEILINHAPEEDKEELKEFLDELSTSKTRTDYNKIRNKDEYKAIFDKYTEFTEPWQVGKKLSLDGKGHNNTYDYNLFLNRTSENLQPKGQIYKVLKHFKGVPEDEDLDIGPINTWIKEENNKREAEYIEQEKEELTRNIRAGAYQNANEKAAKYKNEKEDYEKENEELKKQLEETRNIINDRWKVYIRDHYIIDSPQTREDLFNKVAQDKNLKVETDEDINKYVDYILEKQLKRIITSKTKIIKTAKLFGNDAEYLSKLDPMVREAVLKYQTDLINKTITDKNNKYLLPKKYIKFEKAINEHKVNPLILRGLYVK